MNKLFNYILELIYPNVCGVCEKTCKQSLCKKCEIKIKEYEISLIKKYKDKQMYFDESMHIFKYQDIIRKMLVEYKFQDKAYLYKTFTKIILKNEKICGNLKKYDIIIPVPIHKKRKLIRGYNQTGLIAKEIAKNTALKLETDILFKQKNVKSQSELNRASRKQNVKGAFIINNIEKIKSKNILIFDDVYTTGSTVNECCRILKKAEANRVGILTIAKD